VEFFFGIVLRNLLMNQEAIDEQEFQKDFSQDEILGNSRLEQLKTQIAISSEVLLLNHYTQKQICQKKNTFQEGCLPRLRCCEDYWPVTKGRGLIAPSHRLLTTFCSIWTIRTVTMMKSTVQFFLSNDWPKSK